MPTNDYLALANGVGANVETQLQYVADLAPGGVLEHGYERGVAVSARVNKTLRQSSVMTAAIASAVSETLDEDVLDDGDVAALTAKLLRTYSRAPFQQLGADTALRTLLEKCQESVLSVMDFDGVTGNGVDDDTDGLLAAFTAALAQKRHIYWPAGTYIFEPNATVDLDLVAAAFSMTWYGDGENSSIVSISANNKIFNVKSFGGFGGATVTRLHLEDMSFILREKATNTNATCFYVAYGTAFGASVSTKNVTFFEFTYACIHLIRGFRFSFENTEFFGPEYHDGTDGAGTYDAAGLRMWGADGTLTSQDHSFCNTGFVDAACAFTYLRYGVEIWGCGSISIDGVFEYLWVGIEAKGSSTVSGVAVNAAKAGYGLATLNCTNAWFEAVKWSVANNVVDTATEDLAANSAAHTDASFVGMFNVHFNENGSTPFGAIQGIKHYAASVAGGGSGTFDRFLFAQNATQTFYDYRSDRQYVKDPYFYSRNHTYGIDVQAADAVEYDLFQSPVGTWSLSILNRYKILLTGYPTIGFDVNGLTTSAGPIADNTTSAGTSALRYSVIYAATGAINTSDAREKTDFSTVSDAERRVANAIKALIGKFRFKNAVEQKGDDARLHFGVAAQQVAECFKAEGLNPEQYALFCYDEWPEQPEIKERIVVSPAVAAQTITIKGKDGDPVTREVPAQEEVVIEGAVVQPYRAAGSRYGVRYDELFAFIIATL